ncbi:hypothetical protein LJR289_005373 [Pseudoduganella sp. LjRoot289]|uniref:hypothetical protein n=1 Tax=Pseudoduganella sp. LjRoot289 TaxID=3342314 RepID=UPI003ECE8450
MQASAQTAPIYMRSARFDRLFVLGIPLLALAAGALAFGLPEYFFLILTLDLALLGYHHVISTYTRLLFDLKSARQHWALLLPLPLAVFAGVYLLIGWGGVAAVATLYMHWQWYHYTRQSEGINKAYGMKTRSVQAGNPAFNRATFYLVPAAAFLMMSARPEATFLSMTVWKLPVPAWAAQAAMAAAGASLAWWLAAQVRALRAGTLGLLHFAYLCSHYVIYLVSYVAIRDITTGWLVINVWHNAQYIAFVWLFNSNQFKGGVNRQQLALSWLSQEGRWPVYLLACLALTGVVYMSIDAANAWFENYTLVPLVVIVYQSINFHHYIVDAIIWKLRKREVQSALKIG